MFNLIDTHAHVFLEEFADDLEAVITRAKNNHVQMICMPNLDAASIEMMIRCEQSYPNNCVSMLGLHPCYVTHEVNRQLEELEPWFDQHRFIAVGEIGIDLYHDTTYAEQQVVAFKKQLEWASLYDLPVVIHCRNSFEETITLVEAHKKQHPNLRGVFHCFEGTVEEAERVFKLDFFVGIGGVVTFKNASLAEVVKNVDLNGIVLETDSPYLAPTPYRGKRNEPSYVLHVAEKLSEIKQLPIEEIAAVTTQNALQLFPLLKK